MEQLGKLMEDLKSGNPEQVLRMLGSVAKGNGMGSENVEEELVGYYRQMESDTKTGKLELGKIHTQVLQSLGIEQNEQMEKIIATSDALMKKATSSDGDIYDEVKDYLRSQNFSSLEIADLYLSCSRIRQEKAAKGQWKKGITVSQILADLQKIADAPHDKHEKRYQVSSSIVRIKGVNLEEIERVLTLISMFEGVSTDESGLPSTTEIVRSHLPVSKEKPIIHEE